MRTTLVIGFGNPGRLDDGLGPALAEHMTGRQLPGVTVDSDYQLQVEDAAAIAQHDTVVFIDAAKTGPEPFAFTRVKPKADLSFTSHSVSPGALLAMAHDMFGASTEACMLAIRGYEFDDFGEGLSPQARSNLAAAAAFLEQVLNHA